MSPIVIDEPRTTPVRERGELDRRVLVRPPDVAEAKAIAYAQRALFAGGPKAVSMTEAIAASGVSRRHLLKRFPTRELLIRAAIEEMLESAYREITRNDEFGANFRERYRDMALAFLRRREMFRRLRTDPLIKDFDFYFLVFERWMQEIESRTISIIRSAQAKGELARAYDPILAAYAVWGLLMAMIDGEFANMPLRKHDDHLLALDFVMNGLLSTVHREPAGSP